ncbi:MAG: helix-turn-helix transcriptional regulator [Propionibacteriaceae bacterium]|nr:helix-turn-helix transcriptional regulator [Propionibacteriaceae bacterium]
MGTPEGNVSGQGCPILYALSIIGQKWKLPLLWYLHERPTTRFNELKRRVPGISNLMLTKSLRELEGAGLVLRDQRDTVPPHVEYSLTARGEALLPALNELYSWGVEQMRLEADEAGAPAADRPAR